MSRYPVEFDVEYPDRQLDRVSSFFRIIFAIPILIVLATIGGPASSAGRDEGGFFFAGLAGGILFIPPLLLIVLREKYPRWWFDFNLAYLRFDNRVIAYSCSCGTSTPRRTRTRRSTCTCPIPTSAPT